MPALPLTNARFLLCASAVHCAHVLHAASHMRINVDELTPCTQWPMLLDDHSIILWALLPDPANSNFAEAERRWRAHLLPTRQQFTLHMLYGDTAQQAEQLAPWVPASAQGMPAKSNDCQECLDASSEQLLFQHLLAR